jgi:hypothetical protein
MAAKLKINRPKLAATNKKAQIGSYLAAKNKKAQIGS